MVRLLCFLLIFYLLFRLFRFVGQILASVRVVTPPPRRTRTASSDGDRHLIKDPQCGTYFLEAEGVHAVIDGRDYCFCCEACRDAFLQERRKA